MRKYDRIMKINTNDESLSRRKG